MTLKRLFNIAALAPACLVVGSQAFALDLPVKRVKGKQYYYYKVRKGESLYGISKTIGITVDEIVQSNPSAANGVKKGDLLVFDYEEYTPAEEPAEEIVADTVPAEPVRTLRPSIAVMLPFGLEKAEQSRTNKLALDFYKGMLIAADSLCERPGAVELIAMDTEGLSPAQLGERVAADTLLSTAAVIIAPEDDSAIEAIARAASANGTFVLNTLNIRDTTYMATPGLIQANVPQRRMYELATDALLSRFEGYRPVILRSDGGRNDKDAFVEYATERYRQGGVEPLVIEYKGTLLMSSLDELPCAAGEKYVFIPTSGSLQEFNKFAYVVKAYRDKLTALSAENPENAASAEIFGYPDWTAFRGDALDTLHKLNATVYSRFFEDFSGFSAKNISDDFRRWYGTAYIESIPTYALLGYDSTCYLIKALRNGDGKYTPSAVPFSGIQSTFDFVPSGEGYVNNALYIINYQTGGHVSAFVQ